MRPFFLSLVLTGLLFSGGDTQLLRDCYAKGNEKCGMALAKELVKEDKTWEEGMNIFLDLALRGNTWAPRYVGKWFIYPKNKMKRDCDKGIFFLMAGSKKDPETIKELALLFKRGVCVAKDDKKYRKYIRLYEKERKANPVHEPKLTEIPSVDDGLSVENYVPEDLGPVK